MGLADQSGLLRTHQFQSDEIDIIAIGPPGVRVVEVKHWAAGWVDAHTDLVEQEADKATNKAKKIGTTLRRVVSDLPRVDSTVLLTQSPSKVKRLAGRQVRGVSLHTLKQWKDAVGFDGPAVLSARQVTFLSRALAPKSAVAVDGSMRRLAGYVNLELQTSKGQRFHRVYKGSHPARRDRVVLHLYDLSASDEKNAEVKAKHEADTLQRLQLYPWAPRILDSWQDAPGYAGEMFFFTVVDPAAPCIEDRASDTSWNFTNRLGSGGVGTTFKVVELDRSTGEELGTYVAKVAHEAETGQRVLKAYGLARSHLGRHEALSPIHEFAREWHENDFIALLGWIEGECLAMTRRVTTGRYGAGNTSSSWT